MMQYGHIPGVEKPVSRLVQGTLVTEPTPDADRFALWDAFLELGCNTFDTAHVYENGENERAVGRWINQRGIREQVVIIAKGAHHSQDRRRVTPYDITADIFDSLARFHCDYLDLYLLHRDDPTQPVGPIVEVLNEHWQAGRIHAFGGSNWTHHRIQEANAYAQSRGLKPFTLSSPNFSLAEQVQEPWPNCISISSDQGAEARAWYQQQGLALFTWSSLAGGFFSGRFNRDNLDTFTSYMDKLCVTSYCYEDNFRRLDRVRELAQELGLSTAQIALAYILNQPLNIFALIGSRTPAELRENIAALNLKLAPETLAWLDLKRDSR